MNKKYIMKKKMNLMQNDIDELKKKVNDLNNLIENIGNCFVNMKLNNKDK